MRVLIGFTAAMFIAACGKVGSNIAPQESPSVSSSRVAQAWEKWQSSTNRPVWNTVIELDPVTSQKLEYKMIGKVKFPTEEFGDLSYLNEVSGKPLNSDTQLALVHTVLISSGTTKLELVAKATLPANNDGHEWKFDHSLPGGEYSLNGQPISHEEYLSWAKRVGPVWALYSKHSC